MKKINGLLTVFLGAMFLSNCSSPPKDFISFPGKPRSELGSADVYIMDCDKTMQADIEASNISTYTGGGLIFALVDCAIISHRASCAEEAMVPIQEELALFDFKNTFTDPLIQKLRNTAWLNSRQIKHISKLDDADYQEIFKQTKSDGVLISKFKYKLNHDFNALTGTLYITLYPASYKMKQIANTEDSLAAPLLKFHISATETLPSGGKEIQENASMWIQDNGNRLRNSLKEIINKIFLDLDRILKNPSYLPSN